jgi:hypothetical protein
VDVPWPDLPLEAGIIRQQVDLVVPPEALSGVYTFALRSPSGGDPVRLGQIRLRQRLSDMIRPGDVEMNHPLQADFADGVSLLGYDLPAEALTPGGTLDLTLYWQAQQPVEHRYKVFVHLLGQTLNAEQDNFLWGQQDNEPVNGTRPTTSWREGELIVDRYSVLLDPEAPPGEYAVEVGLYDPATGRRVSLLDSSGKAVADHLIPVHITAGGGQ